MQYGSRHARRRLKIPKYFRTFRFSTPIKSINILLASTATQLTSCSFVINLVFSGEFQDFE